MKILYNLDNKHLIKFLYKTSIILFAFSSIIVAQNAYDRVNGNLIQFNDNGLWCWFQDERAIVATEKGKLVLGSDASQAGVGNSPRNGAIEAVIYDLETGQSNRFQLAKMGCDDHNAPGIILRPDGKYLSLYSDHYDRYKNRYRIFDGNTWAPEQAYNWETRPGGTDYTIAYNNVYYLSAEGRMYNFSRANHRSPNFIVSTDMGDTWTFGGQLTTNTSNSYNKGYYKYWGNGVDRIDFVFTEQHPRDTLTSIYHGYIKGGKAYKSDGTLVDDDIFDEGFIPAYWHFTKVFSNGTTIGVKTMYRCWQSDMVRYSDGTIGVIITARSNQYISDGVYPDDDIDPHHDFIYCRFDGVNWSYTYLGKAGFKFYAAEADYVGLGALCPNDPGTLYISTSFDPRDTTVNLGVREIFKGVTADNGVSWTWTPITENSNRDNMRPIVPLWDEDNTVVLWCRGTYISAQSFDAAVVGIIEQKGEVKKNMNFVDADLNNTTLSSGNTLTITGPDANAGIADSRWHMRTGLGNGVGVLTSSEIGGENAPVLKTTVLVPGTGTYDVWVNFWGSPGTDWRIKAGLSKDNMQIFRQMACKQVEASDYIVSPVLTASGDAYLYQAYIGKVQVTSGNSFDVYIDDEAIQTGSSATLVGNTNRTWYDGISYSGLDPVSTPVLSLSSSEIIFDNVIAGTLSKDSIIVSNTGNDTLDITSITSNNPAFTISPEAMTIIPGANEFLVVTFTAPQQADELSGIIVLENNTQQSYDTIYVSGKSITNVNEEFLAGIPLEYNISQNYPNPFNPITSIKYSIPENNLVNIKIYNQLGEEVTTLVNKTLSPGHYNVTWNAANIPSGVYFYKISAGNYSKINKMILIK